MSDDGIGNANINSNAFAFMFRGRTKKRASLYVILFPVLFFLTFCFFFWAKASAAEDGQSTANEIPGEDAASETVYAKSLTAEMTLSNGGDADLLTDGSYHSTVSFAAGDTLTLSSEEKIYSLYIKWDLAPGSWTLTYDGNVWTYGKKGFLHEYIEIPLGTNAMTLSFSSSVSVCDIYVYSEGEVPSDVQVWEEACDAADLLLFATHADDEILYLGGALATYGSDPELDVQVVYMCEFVSTQQNVREHEKLDGLWYCGLTHYPVSGNFTDIYCHTLEVANYYYSYADVLDFAASCVRRFKPQVVVAQDLNGEYGHGAHILFSQAVTEAVSNCADESFCPDSALTYGTWDTPKTYLHLYGENKLVMDLRTPLENMQGRAAIDILTEAYKKHVSQQIFSFYVSDAYDYSCADFGLYRTTVGYDTGKDMLENVVTYAEQERIEEERLEQARLAEEARLEEERLEEEARIEEERLEQERIEAEENLKEENSEQTGSEQDDFNETSSASEAGIFERFGEYVGDNTTAYLLVILGVLGVLIAVTFIASSRRK